MLLVNTKFITMVTVRYTLQTTKNKQILWVFYVEGHFTMDISVALYFTHITQPIFFMLAAKIEVIIHIIK